VQTQWIDRQQVGRPFAHLVRERSPLPGIAWAFGPVKDQSAAALAAESGAIGRFLFGLVLFEVVLEHWRRTSQAVKTCADDLVAREAPMRTVLPDVDSI
jgi:hypothetical protein